MKQFGELFHRGGNPIKGFPCGGAELARIKRTFTMCKTSSQRRDKYLAVRLITLWLVINKSGIIAHASPNVQTSSKACGILHIITKTDLYVNSHKSVSLSLPIIY